MSAEPRQVTNTEIWRQWEGQVVNDFPLRRFLGSTDHSAVFLTEYKAKNVADVAIKFVPADALDAEAQLLQWRTTAKLPHPHLVRLFAVGRCKSAGREFLFVVMEYAEQTLAQLLPVRALTPDEVQEMLPPILGGMAFLHRNHLVHGQLKPSNFLVVNDQLKLTIDSVRPIGDAAGGVARTSSYDPPELKSHGMSPAGDIWGLGITVIEALTQRRPTWPDEKPHAALLAAGFPTPLVDTVRRCLSPTPAKRPTAIQLEAQYKPVPQARPVSRPQPAREAPRKATPPQSFPMRRLLLPAIGSALLISLAVWVGPDLWRTLQARLQPPAVVAPAPVPVTPSVNTEPAELNPALSGTISRPPIQPSLPPPPAAPLAVLHEVSPDVPPAVRDKIRGHVYVTLRALVDPSGEVVGVLVENSGSSAYFARLASDAAQEWKFAPADQQAARVWLLRFDFSSDGVTTRTTAL